MNGRKDVTRVNWMAIGAGLFLLLGVILALIYVFVIAPELSKRAELRRKQQIAEVIERHGGSVEWIGFVDDSPLDWLNLSQPDMDLFPTAVFVNPEVEDDLFTSSKHIHSPVKPPADQIQRSPFRRSPELFAAIAQLNPDTIWLNRTDFNSEDFAQLKGLQITNFRASETMLDDKAADHLDCFAQDLECACLEYTFITDAFIDKLAKATSIGSIYLEGTKVTSKCAQSLSGEPNLASLDVAHTNFDDEGLAQLEKFPSLRYLNISHTKVTPSALANFKPPPNLRQIEVAGLELPEPASKWATDKNIEIIGLKPTP